MEDVCEPLPALRRSCDITTWMFDAYGLGENNGGLYALP
jgi:hypothetical protein